MFFLLSKFLPGPVFRKEAGQTARSLWFAFARAAFVLALFAAPAPAAWALVGSDMLRSDLGLVLFWTLAFTQLALLLLYAPMATAGAVSGEREANTLGLLLMTRLSSWEVAQDKGAARILLLLHLYVLSFPFLFAALLFGGVEAWQIAVAAADTVGAALMAAGISLYMSSVSNRFTTAVIRSYAAVLFWLVGVPILCLLLGRNFDIRWMWDTPLAIIWWHPGLSMFCAMTLKPVNLFPEAAWLSGVSNLLVGVMGYFIGVALAARRLRSEFDLKLAVSKLKGFSSGVRWLFDLPAVPVAWIFQRGGFPKGNPIAWKEAASRGENSKWTVNVAAVWCVIAFAAVVARVFDSVTWAGVVYVGFTVGMILAGLLTAIVASEVFTRGRQDGTMDILLTTPLSGREIVFGAYFGTLRACALILLLPCLALVVGAGGQALHEFFGFGGDNWLWSRQIFRSWLTFPLALSATLLALNLVVVVSMAVSLACRNPRWSLGMSIAALTGIFIAWPIFVLVVFSSRPDDSFIFRLLFIPSPTPWIGELLTHGFGHMSSDKMLYLFSSLFLQAVGAVASLWLMARLFDRITGRQRH